MKTMIALSWVIALTMATPAAFAQSGAGAAVQDPITLPGQGADDVVVPGTAERPLPPPPQEDVRSAQQRRRDRRNFDRCVARVQKRADDFGSANPVSVTPEEYCAQRTGMRDRNSTPGSY